MPRIFKSRAFIAVVAGICGIGLSAAVSLLLQGGTGDEGTVAYETQLLQEAYRVASALKAKDYKSLGEMVSEKGLLMAPYSTVTAGGNPVFTAAEVKDFALLNGNYIFGADPVTGRPIEMTASEYIETFLSADYSSAQVLGINNVVKRGNAVENVAEAFSDCEFIDFFIQPTQTGAIDWSSLKVVFEWSRGRYRLVALVRSVYTDQ